MDSADLDNRFDYHRPNEARAQLHERTRGACRVLAEHFNRALPEGREKSLAVTKLEEAMFWANAAIARES